MRRLAKTLAQAVLPAFGRFGISPSEYLTGQLTHTDLEWQIPALMPTSTVMGVELHNYMDLAVQLDEQAFHQYWQETLHKMFHERNKVWDRQGYIGANRVVKLPRDVLAFWLSIPEGYPDQLTDYAGVIFSIECAMLMRQSVHCESFVLDDNNFYVTTRQGLEIGVRDGRPLECYTEWDLSAEGGVKELLMMPRGIITTQCDYDVIAKMRSVLWENKHRIAEFEGVDTALQMLRVVGGGPELLSTMKTVKGRKARGASRVHVMERAVETFKSGDLSDRQKIETLRQLLVPALMGITAFSRKIYSWDGEVPPMLAASTYARITESLTQMLALEEELYAKQN